MTEPNFAPLPRTVLSGIPTQRVHYRGYQYWVEGYNQPESYEGGYRYQIQKDGSTDTPATCHAPFDLVTKASFAARDQIDTLLNVLEGQAEQPPEVAEPPPKQRKPRAKKATAKAAEKPAIDPDDVDF